MNSSMRKRQGSVMSRFNGLKKKFWKETEKDLKDLGLPEPASDYGFTDQQLLDSLSKSEYTKFWKWMYGQTMMLDGNGKTIAYTHDVLRGVRLIRHGTPTYWD